MARRREARGRSERAAPAAGGATSEGPSGGVSFSPDVLDDGQDVAFRILEPCRLRAAGRDRARGAARAGHAVVLEDDAAGLELDDFAVDVVDLPEGLGFRRSDVPALGVGYRKKLSSRRPIRRRRCLRPPASARSFRACLRRSDGALAATSLAGMYEYIGNFCNMTGLLNAIRRWSKSPARAGRQGAGDPGVRQFAGAEAALAPTTAANVRSIATDLLPSHGKWP